MNFNDYFGQASDSKEVTHLFSTLNTVQTPFVDEDDIEEGRYTDWVLVKRRGVELGFSNLAWQEGKSRLAWGANNLILTQMYFYSNKQGVESYTGKLPYNLTFNDSWETARHKLSQYENTRRSYITDCWDIDEKLRLTVTYNKNKTIDNVFLRLKNQPLQVIKHGLTLSDINASFRQLANEQLQCLTKLNTPLSKDQWEEWFETNELTLTDEYGIELYIDKIKPARLVAIKFFAPRDRESVGWNGEMPLKLSFEDSPAILFKPR
jgi:hypothetical protein